MISIVDYGMGNVKSVANMLRKIGAAIKVISMPSELNSSEKIVIPGVGAFDAGMSALDEKGLLPVLNERVLQARVPVLGICLGMQLFANCSEEGILDGLCWVDGEVKRFDFSSIEKSLKVPHMGWNEVKPIIIHPLFKGIPVPMRFYFVHSFYFSTSNRENVLSTSYYGNDFAAAIVKDNIMGVQFHPEKSHKYGMLLLKNFVELC
jgi:glutamine amidotransferase